MVDISTLSPGMLVKIVDEWPASQDIHGTMMNGYRGLIGEVISVKDISAFIMPVAHISCNGGTPWAYSGPMIDYVVSDCDEPFSPAPDSDFLSLFTI